jgi:hypothetical protein
MKINTVAPGKIAKPDVAAGQPEIKESQTEVLRRARGDCSLLEEGKVKAELGADHLRDWMLVAEITDQFILDWTFYKPKTN